MTLLDNLPVSVKIRKLDNPKKVDANWYVVYSGPREGLPESLAEDVALIDASNWRGEMTRIKGVNRVGVMRKENVHNLDGRLIAYVEVYFLSNDLICVTRDLGMLGPEPFWERRVELNF